MIGCPPALRLKLSIAPLSAPRACLMAAWLRPVALEAVRALASAFSAAVVADLDLTGKSAPVCPAPLPCPGCPACPACPEPPLLPILACLGLLWLGSLVGAVALLWFCVRPSAAQPVHHGRAPLRRGGGVLEVVGAGTAGALQVPRR